MSCRYKEKCKGFHNSCDENNCFLALRKRIENLEIGIEEGYQEYACMLDCRDSRIKELQKENAELRQKLDDSIKITDNNFYKNTGSIAYYLLGGDIIEVIMGSAKLTYDGKLYAEVMADDMVFPYREPNAEFDTDPTDWCSLTKEVKPDDLGKTLFFNFEEAEKASKGDD